jgi:hypothetical protein
MQLKYMHDESFKNGPTLNKKNILSYIMLFTNECCHVITLMFPLSHFTLKIRLENFRNNVRGITVSLTDLI